MHKARSRTGGKRRVSAVIGTTATTILILLGLTASPVLATPQGIFARFAQCPTGVPGVALCQYAEITGGEVTIGPMRVPIDNTIVLQGAGILTGSPNPNEYFVIPSSNGENLSKIEQQIPRGLRTLIDCNQINDTGYRRFSERHLCKDLVKHDRHNVGMTIEPAASPTNPSVENIAALFLEEGIGLTLPIKLHLQSPILGQSCYIGSETNPIELHLLDGTTNPPPPNQPIKGKLGIATEERQQELATTTVTGVSILDNAFSAPTSEGCGANPYLASIINPLINQTLGLPSPAGENTIVLDGTHWMTEASAVLESEKFPVTSPPPVSPPPHRHHHPQQGW